jgi:hypothetical protein
MKKNELLKECAKVLEIPRVAKWYKDNLETKSQADTIVTLKVGIGSREISVTEALTIALITGVQWNVKFEGTP